MTDPARPTDPDRPARTPASPRPRCPRCGRALGVLGAAHADGAPADARSTAASWYCGCCGLVLGADGPADAPAA